MRKWQELSLNALMNFSVAIMAGGALRLVFDFKNVIASVLSIILGAYILFATTLIAKNTEEKEK